MKVEASAIQQQNGGHLSILVRRARRPFVGQDGILRPRGTRPFRCRNGANRRTGPRHKEAGCQPVCDPAPQRAIDSTFVSRTRCLTPLREGKCLFRFDGGLSGRRRTRPEHSRQFARIFPASCLAGTVQRSPRNSSRKGRRAEARLQPGLAAPPKRQTPGASFARRDKLKHVLPRLPTAFGVNPLFLPTAIRAYGNILPTRTGRNGSGRRRRRGPAQDP
jgi:hypothetical protein